MKKYLLFSFVYLSGIIVSGQTQLPSVQLNTLKGEVINSRSLLNDSVPVVISFWSTICKPCIEELNAFTDRWPKWQKELRFKIVAVATDDARSTARVRTFAAAQEWPFTVLLDKNQDFKRALNINSIPQLYIIGPKGNIVYSRIGYTPGSEAKVLEVLKDFK
jgi:cytochrome c biogenesis protein CcmG, thiol:disulfide interchange protein DsbE